MVKINYYETANNVLAKLKDGKFQSPEYSRLNYLANQLLLKGKKEKLMIEEEIKDKITLYVHQINNALKFLNDMNGRILIADEVGLGKTIEAAIILKELIAREDIKKILILCPSALTTQWEEELLEKFGLQFEINRSVHHWSSYDKIIASIDTAKKSKHIQEITSIRWDLLIIDEAHRLKNSSTIGYKALQNIKADNRIFLTATPIQNNLMELFNIIDLLDKGYFGTSADFKRTFVADDKGHKLTNKERFGEQIKGIMVRNTRKQSGLEFTKRNVYTISIEQTPEEKEFEDIALNFIRERYTEIGDFSNNKRDDDAEYVDNSKEENILNEKPAENKNIKGVGTLQLMMLARMLTSCKYAFSLSFDRYVKKNISDPVRKAEAEKILKLREQFDENKKMHKIVELIKKINEKTIIFTSFIATQSTLTSELEKAGFKVEQINGSMNSEEKKLAIRKLKNGQSDILVSTESGSEGLNLQFCHNLINYDLPWNPMRVEQRIGRIHRIGQEYDINIYNICVKGTIEEYILQKLYIKIDLFKLAIGDIADIVSGVIDEDSFEKSIFDILMKGKTKIDWRQKLDELMNKIKKSKDFQNSIKKFDSQTLDVFNLSTIQNEQ